MTCETPTPEKTARQAWLAVLSRATLPQLERLMPSADTWAPVHQVRPPEIGMVMLRGRVGGTGNPFNLGEASVVRCAVRLGEGPLGISYALGRDKRRAELAALADALLQDPAQHDDVHRTVVAPLARVQAQTRDSQQRAVAGSKVEFFTFVRGEA